MKNKTWLFVFALLAMSPSGKAFAESYGVEVTHWAEAPMARLGVDGEHDVETEGPLASSDFQKNDEVGGMTQFSKRGVWSSENWMGGDE